MYSFLQGMRPNNIIPRRRRLISCFSWMTNQMTHISLTSYIFGVHSKHLHQAETFKPIKKICFSNPPDLSIRIKKCINDKKKIIKETKSSTPSVVDLN